MVGHVVIAIHIVHSLETNRAGPISRQIIVLSDYSSRGTKVEKMLTLVLERYTAGFSMVAKVILWCI